MGYTELISTFESKVLIGGAVKTFKFGYSDEFNDTRGKEYPTVVVFPDNVEGEDAELIQEETVLKFQIMDLSKKKNGSVSDLDTLGNTKQIADDFLRNFFEDNDNIALKDKITFQPLIEVYNDSLTGWHVEMKVKYNNC